MTEFKNIKGGKELQEFLDQLPAKMEANIMRSALRQGANVIKEEAKANVPVESGDLRDSLRVSTRSKRGVVTASVKAGNKKAWYWRFVEFGTAAHKIAGKKGGFLSFGGLFAKSVQHPGARPKPFMRPALDAKANAAIQAVGDQIRKRLTKQGLNAPDIQVTEEE
jgi:HK97 gp10 family phage protein